MSEPTREQQFVKNMLWMINSGEEADAMNNKELAEALCHLDKNHVSSLESAIFGEAVFRLQYPFTWRLRRAAQSVGARYHAWKYMRDDK